jgi:hypothetical protein
VIGRIKYLSLAALRMAASGFSLEPEVVARWLYRFGTLPHGPEMDHDFGPDDDPMIVLAMTVGGSARRLLEAKYDATSLTGWYCFTRTGAPGQLTAACKLYVSPRPEALADAFPRIVRELARSDVRSFKVGRGIEGLLRADKIIAYFDDRAGMDAVAGALCRALSGCPAQGVPFTTDAGDDGLLSWGVDPPLGNEAASWRAWVTKRLAASLTKRCAASHPDPAAAALDDIRRAGVDPERWIARSEAFCA